VVIRAGAIATTRSGCAGVICSLLPADRLVRIMLDFLRQSNPRAAAHLFMNQLARVGRIKHSALRHILVRPHRARLWTRLAPRRDVFHYRQHADTAVDPAVNGVLPALKTKNTAARAAAPGPARRSAACRRPALRRSASPLPSAAGSRCAPCRAW